MLAMSTSTTAFSGRKATAAGPSGPRGTFGARNFLRLMRSPLEFLEDTFERHGDFSEFQLAGSSFAMLCHPEDIEAVFVENAANLARDANSHMLERALGKGLLTSDGELWKRQRRLASAAFTPKRIRGYAGAMSAVTARGLERWRDGEVVNLHEEMSRLTMEVVADVLFGASVGPGEAETVRGSTQVFADYFAQSPEAILRLPAWFPTPRNVAMNKATAAIDALVYRIIEERRRGAERDDLLGALLAATDDDGSRMDDVQLRDELVTLFLAGHETTALALTHALFLLAKHPEIEARLHAEIASVLGDEAPKEDDAPKLVYTERVVKEAMRLYPPAWITGREVVRPFVLRGRTIAPKTQIVMSQWLVHRDPRFFPRPEVFDPDRFEPEIAKRRPRFAYFPFGGGPRICIGNHFAMMEAVLMLAIIAQRFRIDLLPFEELAFAPSVTLRPKGRGVRARVEVRGRARAQATEERAALG
jgi:cytochrome P450